MQTSQLGCIQWSIEIQCFLTDSPGPPRTADEVVHWDVTPRHFSGALEGSPAMHDPPVVDKQYSSWFEGKPERVLRVVDLFCQQWQEGVQLALPFQVHAPVWSSVIDVVPDLDQGGSLGRWPCCWIAVFDQFEVPVHIVIVLIWVAVQVFGLQRHWGEKFESFWWLFLEFSGHHKTIHQDIFAPSSCLLQAVENLDPKIFKIDQASPSKQNRLNFSEVTQKQWNKWSFRNFEMKSTLISVDHGNN